MRHFDGRRHNQRLIIICVALLAIASLPMQLKARATSTSVNIVNNSSREIRNVYLSHVNADDWSGDLLTEGNNITPNHSVSLNNIACDQAQVKVIAEDQDGCFLSTVVNCGDQATWTITNDTAADCGSGS